MYRLLIAATLGADARATSPDVLRVNCKIGERSYHGLKCDWENKGTYESWSHYCRYIWGKERKEAPCGLSYQISNDLRDAAYDLSSATEKWVYPAGFNEMTREEKNKLFKPSATNPACLLKTKGSEGRLICHKIEKMKNGKCVNVVNKNQCGRGTMMILSNFHKDMKDSFSECKLKECNLNGSKSCRYYKEDKIGTEKMRAVARNGEKPECKSSYTMHGSVFRYAPGALCKNGVWVHEGTNKPITKEWDLCRSYLTSDDPEAAWNKNKYILDQ